MEGQINIFEYAEAITDPENRIKEILNDIKAGIASKGYKSDWVDQTIDPKHPGVVFLKNGKFGYKSNCPNYEGYYLCGGFGSVQCKRGGLMPGAIANDLCYSQKKKCPYMEQEKEQ